MRNHASSLTTISNTTTSPRQSHVRDQILSAALMNFAQEGFAGARMDSIASDAGVNKATIYYHIGDKKTLYAEVIHHILQVVVSRLEAAIAKAVSPREKLRAHVRTVIGALRDNPEIAPVILREQASGGRHLPDVVARDFGRIIQMMSDILEEGYERNVFVAATPFLVHAMVVGTIFFFQGSGPVRSTFASFPETVRSMPVTISKEVQIEIENLVLRAVCI